MKYLAFLLSFHLLMLTEMPVMVTLFAQFAKEECGKSCSEQSDTEDATGGCSKESCLTSPCCKLQMVLPSVENTTTQFVLQSIVQRNFSFERLIVTMPSFDIWHPPQII